MAWEPATAFVLQWTDAAGRERERPLRPGTVILGRATDCDVVVPDGAASRRHARLLISDEGVRLADLGSQNGTRVNGAPSQAAELQPGDSITIGDTTFRLRATAAVGAPVRPAARRVPDPPTQIPAAGVVTPELLDRSQISEQALRDAGVEVLVTEYAALGGGLGSFVWVDLLRCSGVPASDIAVVGAETRPYARYQRLCQDSQIPDHERLRSNSDSCPDNVWGFPGYAMREVTAALGHGQLGEMVRRLWQVCGEPAFTETYTPRSIDVFNAIEREMARIRWSDMLRVGRIRAIRQSTEGRLVAIVSASDEQRRRHFAVATRFLHLALGYPAIQLLPDLARYRETTGDRQRVVAAYEHHDHIYLHLRQHGGTVLLRGRGIVASRIVQRLFEERYHNRNIAIVHLHRSRLQGGHRWGRARRRVEGQFEFQPFNWPKGAWGGEQLGILEAAPPTERQRLLETWGGTTTADRSDWKRIVANGTREGWYRDEFGVVEDVKPTGDGRVVTHIASGLTGGGMLALTADFVIDCTGLVASPDRAPLLKDVIDRYGVQRNFVGRLAVTNDFELMPLRHGSARAYAAGATTLGGPLAPVDSFLGLQFAALRAVDAMLRERPRPRGLRTLRGLYSLGQWLAWVRGAPP